MAGEGVQVFIMVDGMLTEVLSVMTVAYRYNFAERTIRQWCDHGKLIAINVEGRWWIPTSEIESYLARRDYYHRVMGQYE